MALGCLELLSRFWDNHIGTTIPGLCQRMEGLCFPLKIGWDPILLQTFAKDEALIREARKAVGDEVTLLIDAGGSAPFWPARLKDALERAKMLANYGVYWFEEPLSPDDEKND